MVYVTLDIIDHLAAAPGPLACPAVALVPLATNKRIKLGPNIFENDFLDRPPKRPPPPYYQCISYLTVGHVALAPGPLT